MIISYFNTLENLSGEIAHFCSTAEFGSPCVQRIDDDADVLRNYHRHRGNGVVIYTVQVNTGGDPTQSIMRDCASGTDKFTEIKTANQLASTFNSIGTSLSNLRISQ